MCGTMLTYGYSLSFLTPRDVDLFSKLFDAKVAVVLFTNVPEVLFIFFDFLSAPPFDLLVDDLIFVVDSFALPLKTLVIILCTFLGELFCFCLIKDLRTHGAFFLKLPELVFMLVLQLSAIKYYRINKKRNNIKLFEFL